jgi:hypothetical protein
MDAEDALLCRHESAHVSCGLILGRKIVSVKRFGQYQIAKGHGVTTFAPSTCDRSDADQVAAEARRSLVCTIAAILWEPTHAEADARLVASIRSASMRNAASDEARALVATPEFRRVAGLIEAELFSRPWLTGEDVERVVNDRPAESR